MVDTMCPCIVCFTQVVKVSKGCRTQHSHIAQLAEHWVLISAVGCSSHPVGATLIGGIMENKRIELFMQCDQKLSLTLETEDTIVLILTEVIDGKDSIVSEVYLDPKEAEELRIGLKDIIEFTKRDKEE